MIQLEADSDFINSYADNTSDTAWRLECSLREFANFKPKNFWFRYPIHVLDNKGSLEKLYSEGDPKNNLKKSSKRSQTSDDRKEEFDRAFDVCSEDGITAKQEDIAEYLGLKSRTIRDRILEFESEYSTEKGIVKRKKGAGGKG